jgi:hypothetical protein
MKFLGPEKNQGQFSALGALARLARLVISVVSGFLAIKLLVQNLAEALAQAPDLILYKAKEQRARLEQQDYKVHKGHKARKAPLEHKGSKVQRAQ